MICCVKMYFVFIIYLNILIVYVSVEAAVITWDNNLPWSHSRNVYSVNYKDGECVNFNLTRTRDGKSIDTRNACITLYAQKDCRGESINFKSNKTFFPFLDRVNFEGKAVSFKKCNGLDGKLLKTRERARYHMILHAGSSHSKSSSSVLSLQSGKCITMPSEWQSRIPQRYTLYETALQIFADENCQELEERVYPLPQRTGHEYEREIVIGSVRVLGSNTSIACTSCPRFLRVHGKEYIFWTYLFSKYGNGYKETFQARVNRSTDGFISWDFLFAADASTPTSIPDVDALQSHIILFGSARPTELSQLGLTEEYIQTLGYLAYDVYFERLEDMKKNPAWADWYNFYIGLWMQMYTSLLSSPKLEFVGRSNYSLEFYGEGAVLSLSMEGHKCEIIPRELVGRVDKLLPGSHCFYRNSRSDCGSIGKKVWSIPHTSFAFNEIRKRNPTLNYNEASVELCDLTAGSLWKSFYPGSKEYDFWMSFLNIYSKMSLEKFKKAVEFAIRREEDVWWESVIEFPDRVTRSKSDQYRFALDTFLDVIRSLQKGIVGTLGFNASNVENLRTLAANVLAERQKQGASINGEWSMEDVIAISQQHSIWVSVNNMLNQTLTNWNPRKAADDVGVNKTGSAGINAKIDLNKSGQATTCGLVHTNKPTHLQDTTPLISGGILAKNGDDPWHAALYRRISKSRDPIYICGATLISPTVLVSAAHCFYDEAVGRALNKTSEYEIILGKLTSDYSAPPDSTSQSKHKIKELVYYIHGYDPVSTDTYGSDIILIILENRVKIDTRVLPVCLDWEQSIFTSPSLDGATGRLVGWGQLSDETYSSYLMTANLPYISFNECKGKVSHLPADKFCAGSVTSGAGARRGDSGGGLVFKHNDGRHYLRGIVSTGNRYSNNSIATFTDLTLYMPWIQRQISKSR